MSKKLWIKYSVFAFIAVLLTVFDQLSKVWIVNVTNSVKGEGPVIIDGILKFSYLENEGASMGMLSGQRIFLIVLTFAILGVGLWYFIKHKPENILVLTASSLILSGAVGNLIDRMFLGYVRDFIEVLFVNFYIFNVADCAICIGAGLMIVYSFMNIKE